jgi:hypothetical protein
MIVYIAGPMTGIADFNYPAFNAAAERLQALGHDVLNPVTTETLNESGAPQTWDWYMRHAIRLVLEAEAIALLPGWPDSRGAVLERTIGRSLGLDVRALSEWMVQL